MMYNVFDTETTGFYKEKSPVDDPGQPYLVQLACHLEDDEGRVFGSLNLRVKIGNNEVPSGAYNVHGISAEDANTNGVEPIIAIAAFHQLCMSADVLVAHNAKFDMNILRTAYARAGRLGKFTSEIQTKEVFCTMLNTTNIVKAPGRGSAYKWPKLIEAYRVLVDPAGFEGAHDAMIDVLACRDIFRALRKGETL